MNGLPDQFNPIDPKERFCFDCNPERACFNRCCRDLCQILTPFDILRLKKGLTMHSAEFLKAYTLESTGQATGLPVISLKPKAGAERECPFVTTRGCRIYPHRPASCRIYPLARGISRSGRDGSLVEHFALVRESHCRGFEQGPSHTPAQWMADQELAHYNRMNDRMMAIIALKNATGDGALDLDARRHFTLALYDLDTFRSEVVAKGRLDAPAKALQAAMESDTALLNLGMDWVKRTVFKAATPQR